MEICSDGLDCNLPKYYPFTVVDWQTIDGLTDSFAFVNFNGDSCAINGIRVASNFKEIIRILAE
jgi:hypothetical protein